MYTAGAKGLFQQGEFGLIDYINALPLWDVSKTQRKSWCGRVLYDFSCHDRLATHLSPTPSPCRARAIHSAARATGNYSISMMRRPRGRTTATLPSTGASLLRAHSRRLHSLQMGCGGLGGGGRVRGVPVGEAMATPVRPGPVMRLVNPACSYRGRVLTIKLNEVFRL